MSGWDSEKDREKIFSRNFDTTLDGLGKRRVISTRERPELTLQSKGDFGDLVFRATQPTEDRTTRDLVVKAKAEREGRITWPANTQPSQFGLVLDRRQKERSKQLGFTQAEMGDC